MRIRKAIVYCYPSSPNAVTLGVAKTGGYYVQQSVLREDGTWSPPSIAQGHDVFQRADDADLIALYHESDGEPDPNFLKCGAKAALRALSGG